MNPIFAASVQQNSYDYQAQELDRPDLISYKTAKEKGHIKRIPEMENEHTFVFRNIDGSITSYTYEKAVQNRSKDGKLLSLTLANQSGSLYWLFHVTTDEQGEITDITADDEECPFALSVNPTTDQYLLTETETPAITYSFTTNDPEENDEFLDITKIRKTEGGNTTDLYRYVYDEAGQLSREDNLVTNQTTTWQYDIGGNIRTKKIYDITAENVTPDEQDLIDSIPYTYDTGIWKDLLATYDGQSIVYDDSGNPTTYLGATLAWTMGRRLESYNKTGLSVQYTYNQDGIRTSKIVNDVTTSYYLLGTQVIAEVTGEDVIDYRYDGYGKLIALRWDGDEYYYVTNIQGDVIGLIDGSGTSVVKYIYDAWGNQTSCTGTLANTLGEVNPYRYRGYRFDEETGLYYLQSRYYDANVGRFINADDFMIYSYNLFGYCDNNPVLYSDPIGKYVTFEDSGYTDNYSYNSSILISRNYIHDQAQFPYCLFRMGAYTADVNGCPWVSTYNALLYLGKYIHPSRIIKYFEQNNGLILNGKYGATPSVIWKYINYVLSN